MERIAGRERGRPILLKRTYRPATVSPPCVGAARRRAVSHVSEEKPVTDREVGRFICDKCGQPIVAAGRRVDSYLGIGAFMGYCPWNCGAWINRGFRRIRPGEVKLFRADEWGQCTPSPQPAA